MRQGRERDEIDKILTAEIAPCLRSSCGRRRSMEVLKTAPPCGSRARIRKRRMGKRAIACYQLESREASVDTIGIDRRIARKV